MESFVQQLLVIKLKHDVGMGRWVTRTVKRYTYASGLERKRGKMKYAGIVHKGLDSYKNT